MNFSVGVLDGMADITKPLSVKKPSSNNVLSPQELAKRGKQTLKDTLESVRWESNLQADVYEAPKSVIKQKNILSAPLTNEAAISKVNEAVKNVSKDMNINIPVVEAKKGAKGIFKALKTAIKSHPVIDGVVAAAAIAGGIFAGKKIYDNKQQNKVNAVA